MRICRKIDFIHPTKDPDSKARPEGGELRAATSTPGQKERLRKEFPFLAAPDCPLELKALVTDRISNYHVYQEAYPELFKASTPEECASVAGKIVNAYIDNRRTWEELNYYQQHQRILGHHPIFRQFANVRKLRTMSIKDLIRREERVKKNIWRVQSEMKKGDKPNLDDARRTKINAYRAELAEIQRLLE